MVLYRRSRMVMFYMFHCAGMYNINQIPFHHRWLKCAVRILSLCAYIYRHVDKNNKRLLIFLVNVANVYYIYYWHCPHTMRSRPSHLSDFYPSVRPFVCPRMGPHQQAHHCRFAAGGPAGRRYRSIAARRTAARRANAGSATLSAYT